MFEHFLLSHLCSELLCRRLVFTGFVLTKDIPVIIFAGTGRRQPGPKLRSLEKVLHLKYVDNFWYAYFGCHDLPKRTDEKPKRTSLRTGTDFNSYQNEFQWEPEKVGWGMIGTTLMKKGQ